MHNNFVDKNRRLINLKDDQVGNVLPEYFRASYPKFITLLESYYEWTDVNDSTELLNHLFASRDINETDVTLLSYIEDELLLGESYFDGFGESTAELRAAANFSNVLFRSKGSKFAIEWFFRSFYQEDVEVIYTKENIFTIGQSDSRLGAESLRYLTNDELYQTWALLIKSAVPISQWKDLFKLFSHPAGMYLGSEVLVIGESLQNVLDDQIEPVTARTSETYAFTVNTDSALEGTTFDFTLTANNLRNNYGVAKWYVEHVTTSDSDFSTILPDISSPQNLLLDSNAPTSAVSTFSIVSLIDDVDGEEGQPPESFNVISLDKDSNIIDTLNINLVDVSAGYTISDVVSGTSAEGVDVEYTITGTNVPDNGNTTLYWWVNHVGTDADDFVGQQVPTAGIGRQAVSIANDSGRFSLQTRIDNIVDNNEVYEVKLETLSQILKDTHSHTVTDVVPTFTCTPIAVTEGGDFSITLAVDPTTVGTQVAWTTTANTRLIDESGSFVITGTNDNYVLTGTTVTLDTKETAGQGLDFDLTLATDDAGAFPTPLTTTPSPITGVEITNLAPTYDISFSSNGSSSIVAQEGDILSLTFEVTNLVDNSAGGLNTDTLYWFVDYTGGDPAEDTDFSPTPPKTGSRDSIIFGETQVQTTTPTLTLTTENETGETFTIKLFDSLAGGIELASLEVLIISGTASNEVLVSTQTPNEGGDITFTFNTNGLDGTYYYWMDDAGLGYLNAFDFAPVNGGTTGTYHSVGSRGTFTVSSGTGSVVLTVAEDANREGVETFTIQVSSSAVVSAIAGSPSIDIADTSVPTTVVKNYTGMNLTEASTVIEGNDLYIGVTSTGNQSPAIPYDVNITGTGASYYTTTPNTIASPDPSGTSYIIFTANAENNSGNDGNRPIEVSVVETLNSTEIGTYTITLTDPAPVYTLTVAAADEDVDELDTVTFTFGGTNVPDGDYYYRPDDIIVFKTEQEVTSGNSIYLDNSSFPLIEVGMVSDDPNIGGTVTSYTVGTGVVTMSQSVSGTIVNDKLIRFAEQEVFDKYTGTTATGVVSTTSNVGTFDVEFATNPSYGIEVIQMRVFNFPYDTGSFLFNGDLLKSKNINLDSGTLTHVPQLPANGSWDYTSTFDNATGLPVSYTKSLYFYTDGYLYITGGADTGSSGTTQDGYYHAIQIGGSSYIKPEGAFGSSPKQVWVSDLVAIPLSDFRIKVNLINGSTSAGTSGSFGTWLSLSSAQTFSMIALLDGVTTVSLSKDFEVIVEHIPSGTTDSTTLLLTTVCNYTGGP